jgi:hypothetical protein
MDENGNHATKEMKGLMERKLHDMFLQDYKMVEMT